MDVIIVHYHAAASLAEAVSALRSQEIAPNIIVADNGSTPDERALLKSLDVVDLDVGRNAGYAGGLNAAMRISTSDAIVVMNEDVVVLPGCLKTLQAALTDGAAVAGPEFFWDRDCTFRLPCTEERSTENELLKITDPARARRRWREHARLHWRSRIPMESVSLSGALLAFRRDAWNAVGPMDEGFALYFEENDWLLRVAGAGFRSMYVPAAKAVHLHRPSGRSMDRGRMWRESFERFGNRYYGNEFMRQLFSLAEERRRDPEWGDDDDGGVSWPLWIELTPEIPGFPAAAACITDRAMPSISSLPFRDHRLYLQIVDDAGRELSRRTLDVAH